ncbi:putative quinol monooxygenase [Vogesella indigofera]|uniref:putative quinol monooxygenase n=1 Tax=Vogesella indigofera TaxID=45465 RepID=UPI003F444AA9
MKINATIHANILPGKLTETRQLLETLVKQTHLEEGCELYEFALDGSRLLLAERWTSQEHLDRHTQTAHFLACVPALKACCEGGTLQANFVQSESVSHLVI